MFIRSCNSLWLRSYTSTSMAPNLHILSSLIGIAPIPCLPSMCPCTILGHRLSNNLTLALCLAVTSDPTDRSCPMCGQCASVRGKKLSLVTFTAPVEMKKGRQGKITAPRLPRRGFSPSFEGESSISGAAFTSPAATLSRNDLASSRRSRFSNKPIFSIE